jgi:hypothetical protein
MDINTIRIIRNGLNIKASQEDKDQQKRLDEESKIIKGCLKLSDYMAF